jgi:hypothetical protein
MTHSGQSAISPCSTIRSVHCGSCLREDVQREIAVAAEAAAKEALRLMAVERDAGRVQIEHDLLRSARVRLQKQVAQQAVQSIGRVTDLMTAPGAANHFQTVQRLFPAVGSSFRSLHNSCNVLSLALLLVAVLRL